MSIFSIKTSDIQLSSTGDNPLKFDFGNATEGQIIAHLTKNPAEKARYLAHVDAVIDELLPIGAVDGATRHTSAQMWQRELNLSRQLFNVQDHFYRNGDVNFAGELWTQYDRLLNTPGRKTNEYLSQGAAVILKGLTENPALHEQELIAAIEFKHESIRYQIDTDEPNEAQFQSIKGLNVNLEYILANDPERDANSQAFHARLSELITNGKALGEEYDIKLHHWRRG